MSARHAVGSPSWFELATTDQNAAKCFYASVFDWKAQDKPLPDGSVYTIFELNGREVAACYTLMAAQQQQGVPPHWGVYFRVEDADATVAKARANGGKVLAEPFEVAPHLRMAVCSDSEGAVFFLHQPHEHHGVTAIREKHAVCWVELATRDIDRAESFYRGLFDWQTEAFPGSPTPYRLYGNSDGKLGGLLQMTAEWGEIPSHWAIYLQVEDVDAVVASAVAAGGKLCVPAFDVPNVGRIARIDDPTGAGFYIISFPAGMV